MVPFFFFFGGKKSDADWFLPLFCCVWLCPLAPSLFCILFYLLSASFPVALAADSKAQPLDVRLRLRRALRPGVSDHDVRTQGVGRAGALSRDHREDVAPVATST